MGASAASLPNSSGVNARTVVVRAFPDDVIATANCVIVAVRHFDHQSHIILTSGDIRTNKSPAQSGHQPL